VYTRSLGQRNMCPIYGTNYIRQIRNIKKLLDDVDQSISLMYVDVPLKQPMLI
jgi:hypothetical protein